MASIIGITGGIGSGKSLISSGLRQMGYEVYNTDKAARRLMNDDADLRCAIIGLLGDVYENGKLVAARVAEQVFADEKKLSALNAIVHPAVFRDLKHAAQMSDREFLFAESAILFESGMQSLCRCVITVSAPEELRIERTMVRDGVGREDVISRMSKQMSDKEREELSQFVVKNGKNAKISDICFDIINFLRNFVG